MPQATGASPEDGSAPERLNGVAFPVRSRAAMQSQKTVPGGKAAA